MNIHDSSENNGNVPIRRRTPIKDEEATLPKRFLQGNSPDLTELDPHTRVDSIDEDHESPKEKREIQEALETLSIDEGRPVGNLSRRQHRKETSRPLKRSKKKLILRIIIIVIILAVAIAGFLGIKAFIISNKIFNGGNLLSLITPGTPLATDSQGRTNIILFGTSQDDSSHQSADGGGGLWLTDSIELVSIDQKANTVKLTGIPRDLWVSIDNCEVGPYAKINAVYECASNLINSSAAGSKYASQDSKGAKQLMNTIEQVAGITPQYYIHADYSVLKQAVDAVGGIDVNIKGDGSSGIYDTNFDWECSGGAYTCKNVYYAKDGTYHLNGTQALFLSRARGDIGAYSYKDFGLNRGDFDRQANQQKILIALQAKVKTAGVLANPIALNGLIDAFGNNISTSFSGGEIKTLLTFSKSLPNNAISQVSLVQTGSEAVTTDMVNGQSVVVPTSGTYDYSSIVNYLAKQLSTNPAVAENATIAIYNASGTAGAAKGEQATIEKQGLSVDTVGDADSSDAGNGQYTLYDQSKGTKPKTLAQLKKTLGVTTTSTTLPSDITSTDNFIIIIN